jgi:phage-related minor tail protein
VANNIKGITIEIGGDTTKLDKALGSVNKNVKSTQSELREVEKLLKLDPKNTEALEQKQKLLAKAVGETKEKLDVLKTAEAQVEEQFKNGEVSEEQYRALKREIEATELSLKKLEEEANKSNLSLEKVGEAFGKVGSKATDIGKKMLPVTAGIAGMGTAGVAAAMELDDGYDTIITKTGATGEALEELNAVADELFTEMPIEMADAGTAVGEINTRFGATGETLKGLSKQFIEFANINGTDLNNSIGKVDKIMEQYNIDAAETGNVLGLITKKGQETGISVDTLMDSLQKNGATFKEMGLNMVQSTNLLAQFEANGVNADTAVAGLRKSIKAYTDEGKSVDEALALTIDSIKNASSETEALSIAQEVFGTKGAAEMATAIREGRIDLESLSSSMEEYGSVVEDTFNATQDPWDEAKVATNNLKLAAADLGTTLLGSLQPTITKIVNKIKEFTQWFKNLNQSQKETIIKVAAVVAAIGPALIIFGKVATTISTIISVVGKIGPAVKAAKAAFSAFNAVLAANPIILVVTAIVAVIAILVTLYKKCEWFRNGVNAIWEAIKNAFFAAWDGIKTFFTETLPNAFNTVVNFIKSNWQALLLLIVNPFAGAFKLLYDNCGAFREFVDNFVQNIKQFFQNLWNGIVSIFQGVGQWFIARFTEAYNGVTGVFAAIGQWFGARWQDIKNALATVASWFLTMFTNAYTNVKNVFALIGQWFGARWQDIKNALATVASWFLTMFTNAYTNVKNVFALIGQWFGARWQDIKNALATVASWFLTMFTNAYTNVKNVFSAIGSWFGARWTEIKTALSAVPSWFGTQFQNAWTNIKNAFANVTSFFSGLWEKIKGCFVNVGVKIGSAVGDAFKSAINSCLSTIEGVVNKFIGMINGVIGVINEIPGVSLGKISTLSLPRLAKGGILKEGTAMVAEAGPELLSMVNGKAVVTPLSGSAKNQAMENAGKGGGGYVQNVNITSPKALSPYEIARQTRLQTRSMILAVQRG